MAKPSTKKDGSLYHESLTITPVADEAGAVTHFVAVKQDISARIQTQQVPNVRTAVLDRFIARPPCR